MDRSEREDPADGEGDDVVEHGGHRFAALNWSPPRGVVLAAAGLAAGLVIGLAGGYAAGERHAGAAASGATASPAILTEPDASVLDQSGGECSAQTGHELQIGVQVTNQTPTQLTLRQVKAVLPLGGLRAIGVRWAPCGTVPESQAVPGNQVPPGATTWITVTFQVLAKCPGPFPIQFTVGYVQNGQLGSAGLPGFPDLTHVPYSGCPGQSSPLRVQLPYGCSSLTGAAPGP
jgi:hypothetical protein